MELLLNFCESLLKAKVNPHIEVSIQLIPPYLALYGYVTISRSMGVPNIKM